MMVHDGSLFTKIFGEPLVCSFAVVIADPQPDICTKATEEAEMLLMHTWKVAASEHSRAWSASKPGCFNRCFTNRSNNDGDFTIRKSTIQPFNMVI